jgi:hypothetical protein
VHYCFEVSKNMIDLTKSNRKIELTTVAIKLINKEIDKKTGNFL